MADPVPFVDGRYLVAVTDQSVHFDGVFLAVERPGLGLLRIVAELDRSVAVDIVAAFAVAIADDDRRAAGDRLAAAASHIVVHLYTLLVFSNNH